MHQARVMLQQVLRVHTRVCAAVSAQGHLTVEASALLSADTTFCQYLYSSGVQRTDYSIPGYSRTRGSAERMGKEHLCHLDAHTVVHISSLHCSIHSCGYMATSLWHSKRASHIHPHMPHLLKLWPLLTEQLCCRKSTTKPKISQLHLRALLQGTSVVGDVERFIPTIYLPATNALPGLGVRRGSPPSSSQSVRNLTCFTH